MERVIKFRTWDEKERTMSLANGYGSFDEGYPSLDSDRMLLQFTGLKDKNGIEIYEGDVVETIDGISYVRWTNGCMWLSYNNITCYTTELGHHYKDSGCEIIGNIYENPELIERKV